MMEELLLPFADLADSMGAIGGVPTLYVNVPVTTIRAVLEEHGGMVEGQLPDMEEERDEDDIQWAAAAPAPSTDPETDEEVYGSPVSAVHLGAPPPLPPPLTPQMGADDTDPHHAGIHMGSIISPTAFLGALPPPLPLLNAVLSPILLITDKTDDDE